MKKALDILFGSLQAIILTISVTIGLLVALLYVAVHSRLASMAVEHSITNLLAEQIGTQVTVDEDVEVSWDNQIVLNRLTIYDQQGEKMIYARRAMVAFELWPLFHNHLVINTCQLIEFDIRTYRANTDSVANYQFLIDALTKHKNPERKPFIQQLDLNFILLRQGTLTYDVADRPHMKDSPIDPYHVEIQRLSANVHVHDKELLIKKLHCTEHDNSYHAEKVKVALDFEDVLQAPAGEHRMLIYAKGLEVEGRQLSAHVDIEGDSDTVELLFRQLSLPMGHPRLPGVNELHTNAIIRLSQLSNPIEQIYASAEIRDLDMKTTEYGNIHIDGTAEGQIRYSQLSLTLQSDIGNMQLNATLQQPEDKGIQLEGHLITEDTDLARLQTVDSQLGLMAGDLHFLIDRRRNALTQISVDGEISRLEWRRHNYHDIQLNCIGQKRHLQGTVEMRDTLGNLAATFDLDLDHPRKHLSVAGHAQDINPQAMHLCDVTQLDSLTLTCDLKADINASRLADFDGEIHIADIHMAKGDRRIEIGDIDYQGNASNGRLTSQVLNILYTQQEDKGYNVQGNVARANALLSLLNIPVSMSESVRYEAQLDSAQHLEYLFFDVPELCLNQKNYVTAKLTATQGPSHALQPSLDIEVHNAEHRLKGFIEGQLHAAPQQLTIEPSTLIYNNEEVLLSGARISRLGNGDVVFEDIRLTGGAQEVSASGVLAQNGDKDLVLSLSNFDLGQVFSNFDRGYVHFGGRATGDIVLTSSPELLLTAEDLKIRHFSYIDTLLGNANIDMAYSIPQEKIAIACDVVSPTQHPTHIDCDVSLGDTSALDLRVHPDHLPLGFINYWCGNILQRFSGTVTGDVRLYGPTSAMQLAGTPVVDGWFTHDMIGANFHLKDTVFLSDNLLRLDHAYVEDGHGHPLSLTADVRHNHLHDFYYDVDIDMPNAKQGFLVLDRAKAPGRMYWGQIYARGKAHLAGGNSKHRIDVDFATTDKSWFYISPRAQDLNPDQEAYSFLTFRDKAQLSQLYPEFAGDTIRTQLSIDDDDDDAPSDIEVKLIANATEQCEVTVQMDPSSEDLLVGRGNGTLNIVYNPQHDLTLTGEYRVNSGTYTMNFNPDIINKRFQLQNTSLVSFNGVPSEANLKLDATLNIPSVNLSDLGEQVTAMKSLSRTTVPIDCKMNVTGQLAAPKIDFDLEVKNGNKEVDDLVHNAIGTPEMINQQVLYLLLFSKFYPPEDVQSQSQIPAGAELSSLASASIASQLNQLLNRLSDNFTLGTNFKSERGDFSDMEMDVSLSTRLLNNRLLLYGNVGYRDPANRIGMVGNSSSFIGDFDIEYIINAARTLRAKVYSHYNERDYSINNALTTQGVGLIWHHDFDTFGQIWHRRNWLKHKKDQDSTAPTDEKP